MLMREGPHQTNIGWAEVRIMRTHVLKPWSQLSGSPSGVVVQSNLRMRSPISPPPDKKFKGFDMVIMFFKSCLLSATSIIINYNKINNIPPQAGQYVTQLRFNSQTHSLPLIHSFKPYAIG